VLRETTSRGLCGLGCPSRTSERGGEGDCVKEGTAGMTRRFWVVPNPEIGFRPLSIVCVCVYYCRT
jgi:hypothetical protein